MRATVALALRVGFNLSFQLRDLAEEAMQTWWVPEISKFIITGMEEPVTCVLKSKGVPLGVVDM